MHAEILNATFGLTPLESRVYQTLLQQGASLAGLITQKSGIHRRSVYDALERLIQKGMVAYIVKNNRKYFEAANPDHLFHILKEKEETFQKILPELKEMYAAAREHTETLFFRGKEGLKMVFEDQLQLRKEIFVIGASPFAKEILSFYLTHYNKRRIAKKIPFKLLYEQSARKERKLKHAEIRYLPKEFASPAATNIYDDKVAIIHWSKENPFVILIKEKSIAESYRQYFKVLWDVARK